MSHTTTTSQGQPRGGRWLMRWAPLVVVCAVLGGVAAAAYAATLAESYTSSARVLIRPSVGNPLSPGAGSSSQQVTTAVATEAALVDSAPVLALVTERTGTDLRGRDVSTNVPPNTSTIVMTVQAGSADKAEENAQALAEAFLQYRQSVSEESKASSNEQLTEQLGNIRTALTKIRGEGAVAARRADVLTARLVASQSALVEVRTASTDPGTVLTRASAGTRSALGDLLLVIGGVLGGVLVGLLLSYLVSRWRERASRPTRTGNEGAPEEKESGDRNAAKGGPASAQS